MENIQTLIGWGIVGFLAFAIAVLLITIVFTLIRCIFKRESLKPTIYLVLFAGIFVFVLFSLGMLVLAQYRTLKGEAGTDSMGSFFALISLCLSLSAIVPFFVSKALTERDVEKKVDNVLNDREKQIMKIVSSAESRLHTSDADISRMVGYLLAKDKPDYFWSLSWLARSIKSRMSANEGAYSAVDNKVSKLFVVQEMRMIAANLVKIYESHDESKGFEDAFTEYEGNLESRYTGEIRSAQGTLARVLRDYMYLLEDMTPGDELDVVPFTGSVSILVEDLCAKIRDYLVAVKGGTQDKLASEMVCRSFKKDSGVSVEKNIDRLKSLNKKETDKVNAALEVLKKGNFKWY